MSTPMYEVYKAAKELQGKIDFVLNNGSGASYELNDEQVRELHRIGGEVDSAVAWCKNTFGFEKGGAK